MGNLFNANTPKQFWRCPINFSEKEWNSAIEASAPILETSCHGIKAEDLLEAVLGEGQFGPNQWNLSLSKRMYYLFKPFLPRKLTQKLRQLLRVQTQNDFPLGWPIEDRYVNFHWHVMQNLFHFTNQSTLPFIHFWPGGHRYAFVLTHDIETADGQDYIRHVADLEVHLGFRSLFNFVPERYNLDQKLIQELRESGFEIGVHGLKHDGKLFCSEEKFNKRVHRINKHLRDFGAVAFRAPLTHRHPEWMQALDIEYDLSFFDTDPFEPIPGGTMSIWPFLIGHFIEMPYTLVQDHTLMVLLGERTPRLWTRKVDFIEKYNGMVLVNTHPDYLQQQSHMEIYETFLKDMKARKGYWHALPNAVARWWRSRGDAQAVFVDGRWIIPDLPEGIVSYAKFSEHGIEITFPQNGK